MSGQEALDRAGAVVIALDDEIDRCRNANADPVEEWALAVLDQLRVVFDPLARGRWGTPPWRSFRGDGRCAGRPRLPGFGPGVLSSARLMTIPGSRASGRRTFSSKAWATSFATDTKETREATSIAPT